ncbi:hypothetical protein [Rhodocista pekingensis]|uniref:Prepilin type IV endopeptidase peptidase domain-containing protein n=1 Tax=Rhodocista pekingensis TaxID=201185 RepID=A0ABW2KQL0_9PROT
MDWTRAAGPAPVLILGLLAAHAAAFGHRPAGLPAGIYGLLVSALALGAGVSLLLASGRLRCPSRLLGIEGPLLLAAPYLLARLHDDDGPDLLPGLAVVVAAAAGSALLALGATLLLRQMPGAERVPVGAAVAAATAALACLKGRLMLALF